MRVLARTEEQVLFQQAVFLIVAHDVAVKAAADPHTTPQEQRAARVHADYCAARLRRIDALLAERRGVRTGYSR